MKPRKIIPALAVFVLLVAGGWWFMRSGPDAVPLPAKAAKVPLPTRARADSPPLTAPTPTEEPSTASPTIMSNASSPKTASDSRQQGLNLVMEEGLRVLASGDVVKFARNYLDPGNSEARAARRAQIAQQYSPEVAAQMLAIVDRTFAQMTTTPDGQRRIQVMTALLQAMKTMTPTFNETGDHATYANVPRPDGGQADVVWVRVDDQWQISGSWYAVTEPDSSEVGKPQPPPPGMPPPPPLILPPPAAAP